MPSGPEKFKCKYCQDYSLGKGGLIHYIWADIRASTAIPVDNHFILECLTCGNYSILKHNDGRPEVVYPNTGILEPAPESMPEELRKFYDDANNISSVSIRGAVAGLRICLEAITVDRKTYVDNNLEQSTTGLIKKEGLNEKRYKPMLDLLRKAGNCNSHARNTIEYTATELHLLNKSILYVVQEIYGMEMHDKDVHDLLDEIKNEKKKP